MSEKTFSHKGYSGSIEVSVEDDCLHGKLLFINDLITYEAETPVALERAFKEAVDYYLQRCQSEGLVADKPFSGSFNIRITAELHRSAAMRAASVGVTLNEFVRECIASKIDELSLPAALRPGRAVRHSIVEGKTNMEKPLRAGPRGI